MQFYASINSYFYVRNFHERSAARMLSSAYVWAKVLGQLESKMPSISTWFDDCEVVELTGQTLIPVHPHRVPPGIY